MGLRLREVLVSVFFSLIDLMMVTKLPIFLTDSMHQGPYLGWWGCKVNLLRKAMKNVVSAIKQSTVLFKAS